MRSSPRGQAVFPSFIAESQGLALTRSPLEAAWVTDGHAPHVDGATSCVLRLFTC